MNIILDSCSIVNLINGGCLDKILTLPGFKFYVGDILIENELLNSFQKSLILTAIQKCLITNLNDDIPISIFSSYNQKFNLGIGETECIIRCKKNDFTICTDDKKARKCAKEELGQQNVIGSLHLLKLCVSHKLMSCEDAIASYEAMQNKGGFLPKKLDKKYFCEVVN